MLAMALRRGTGKTHFSVYFFFSILSSVHTIVVHCSVLSSLLAWALDLRSNCNLFCLSVSFPFCLSCLSIAYAHIRGQNDSFAICIQQAASVQSVVSNINNYIHIHIFFLYKYTDTHVLRPRLQLLITRYLTRAHHSERNNCNNDSYTHDLHFAHKRRIHAHLMFTSLITNETKLVMNNFYGIIRFPLRAIKLLNKN